MNENVPREERKQVNKDDGLRDFQGSPASKDSAAQLPLALSSAHAGRWHGRLMTCAKRGPVNPDSLIVPASCKAPAVSPVTQALRSSAFGSTSKAANKGKEPFSKMSSRAGVVNKATGRVQVIEQYREQFRRKLQEQTELQSQAIIACRYKDWSDLQQEHDKKMVILRKDLHLALERTETLERDNEVLHHRLTSAEGMVCKLRERCSKLEEQLACYELAGDAVGKFMKYFNYGTAEDAVRATETMQRTIAMRDEQLAAYETRHALLEEQLQRTKNSSEEKIKEISASLTNAEALKAKAEQSLQLLQREHQDLSSVCRKLSRIEKEHEALREVIETWHQSWMQKAKYWNYVSIVKDNNLLTKLRELNELADQFVASRVSLTYQEVCNLAAEVCSECFPQENGLLHNPLKTFRQLYEAFIVVSHQNEGLQRQVAIAASSSINFDCSSAELVTEEPTSPKLDAVESAVKLLQRRQHRKPSSPQLADVLRLQALVNSASDR